MQCRGRLCRDALAPAGKAELFRGRRLDRNTTGRQPADFRDPGTHGLPVRADLRRLADERQVDMGDLAATRYDGIDSLFQEEIGRRALPLRIGGREVAADVSVGKRAENRVGDGVEADIGVGMAGKRPLMRDLDAAKRHRAAIREGMHIKAAADADVGKGGAAQAFVGGHQILIGGQLDVLRVALDQVDVERHHHK